MVKNNYSQQIQSVKAGWIQEITNSFSTHKNQSIAFANLWIRIMTNGGEKGSNILTQTTAFAAYILNLDKTNLDLRKTVETINTKVHHATDLDHEFVFNQKTGLLSEKALSDLVAIEAYLISIMPQQIAISSVPKLVGEEAVLQGGAPLINNNIRLNRYVAPVMHEALDVLFSQGFALNNDITALTGLPTADDVRHSYLRRQRHAIQQVSELATDKFYFQYTLDYRGRQYCRNPVFNVMDDSFSKAIVNFSESKPLGKNGLGALMIHYANVSGQDKLSFDDRVAWSRSAGQVLAKKLRAANNNWLEISKLIGSNRHAFEQYATAMDYLRAVESSNPSTYESSLVTHQDATNSGFQFGAALTGCTQLALHTNLTGAQNRSTQPGDLYKVVAEVFYRKLESFQQYSAWLPYVNRNMLKQSVMIIGYGAGMSSVLEKILLYVTQEDGKSDGRGIYVPHLIEPFLENETYIRGEGFLLAPLDSWSDKKKIDHFCSLLEEALSESLGSMLGLTSIFKKDIAKYLNDNNTEIIQWVAPDGFRVKHEHRTNEGRRIGTKKTFTLRDLPEGEKDPIDKSSMANSLPPNFIHSIDGFLVRLAARMSDKEKVAFVPIHDSFGTHAGTYFNLHTILKKAFVETMSYPWFENFLKENKLDSSTYNIKVGSYDSVEAISSTYMFS